MEEKLPRSRQLDDGTHVIPIHRVQCCGCDSCADATGFIRWDLERGASFSIDFPEVHQTDLETYWRPQNDGPGVGRFSVQSNVPSWTAETSEGLAVRLFGTQDTPTSEVHYGTTGSGHSSSISGSALMVEVEFAHSNPLSFYNATLPHPRILFIGHGVRHWESVEPVEFYHEDGRTTTNRCTVQLSESPDVRIVAADARIHLPSAGWLTVDSSEDANPLDYPFASERSFISFLNGHSVPFMWMDEFPRDNIVKRVYFGWSRIQRKNTDFTDTEPLPMCGSVESFEHGKDVVGRLPELFRQWISLDDHFEFDWVLSPLWTARRSFLDDKVALASISLERLAAEWSELKKRSGEPKSTKFSIWKDQRFGELKQQLLNVVDTFDASGGTSDECTDASPDELAEALRIIRQRVNSSLMSPANEDKLTLVFQDLGILVTENERKTIKYRNRALHGNRTLRGSCTSDFDNDGHRYDILRMLVTKALLSILRYDGPYMNYAARPEHGNFPVEILQFNTVTDASQ
ncbi:hypothetical protein [Thalassoglobus polymorphus]|uniref:ApeA N-terminal domain-containing protein n=1 Tax=Thalassoglobus polymorphus TaxID=2527994 RepID=A0A517QIQ2_9PLAN|nr:hypothetical protein [Thalassoglobus polymorphus]QDT31486.1 hypothetical protein Mal48_07200 [Thalassoglobus polymorphus]